MGGVGGGSGDDGGGSARDGVATATATRTRSKATGTASATTSVGPDIGVGGDHGGGSVVVDGDSGCYAADGSAADGDFGDWFHLSRWWSWRQLLLRSIGVLTLRRLFGSHRALEHQAPSSVFGHHNFCSNLCGRFRLSQTCCCCCETHNARALRTPKHGGRYRNGRRRGRHSLLLHRPLTCCCCETYNANLFTRRGPFGCGRGTI